MWQIGHTFIFEWKFIIPWGLQFGLFCPLLKDSWCNTTVDQDGKSTCRSKSWHFQNFLFSLFEYSKVLYTLTAQKCSGRTADHLPAEHFDTYCHKLHPTVRTDSISRNMPSHKNSLGSTNKPVTPSGDAIKPFYFTRSTWSQCLSQSSFTVNTVAIFERRLSNY